MVEFSAVNTQYLCVAICWYEGSSTHEVIVQGMRQGVNTKKTAGRNSRLAVHA